ncbi:MAG: AraC family transcriptional regulator [Defluviitaleaceae bacterium]|nr:AraC family transcriptional regulator [Defluviitaleaceae bacterium]
MSIDDFNNAIPVIEYFIYRNNTPNWMIIPSQTDFIDLTYIIDGKVTYTINNEKLLVETGDILCIPRNSNRSAISSPPQGKFACFATNFHLHSPQHKHLSVPLPLMSHIGINDDLILQFKKMNDDWLWRSPGYTMRARARFMLILQRIMEMLVYDANTCNLDSRVKTAIRYITNHYAEPISISEVANEVSLNPVYFGSLFKKETKTAFRDYLNMIRLNYAEGMLHTGKWNVTEVALKCGFSDVFYFSRLFKKHKGVPPSSVQP